GEGVLLAVGGFELLPGGCRVADVELLVELPRARRRRGQREEEDDEEWTEQEGHGNLASKNDECPTNAPPMTKEESRGWLSSFVIGGALVGHSSFSSGTWCRCPRVR